MHPNTDCRRRRKSGSFRQVRQHLLCVAIFFLSSCHRPRQPYFLSNINNEWDGKKIFFCHASAVVTTKAQKRSENDRPGFFATVGQTMTAVAGDTNLFRGIPNGNGNNDDRNEGEKSIGISGYQSDYSDDNREQPQLRYGHGESFFFTRFQSPARIRRAFDAVRSRSSFHWFEGKDGRKGKVSTTKLGGDYVLAESEQVAVDCSTEDVLRAYLSGDLQVKWSDGDLLETSFTKCRKQPSDRCGPVRGSGEFDARLPRGTKPKRRNFRTRVMSSFDRTSNIDADSDGKKTTSYVLEKTQSNTSSDTNVNYSAASENNGSDDKDKRSNGDEKRDWHFYRQDLLLKSQRVLFGHTGTMRYQQIVEIDKIGKDNYSALVRLLKPNAKEKNGGTQILTTTAKKPFESLHVYVGLEQAGSDVKIYAAGVFEVNRKVVPKIIVFDTSGFAGSLAGKGTLWLSSYFEHFAPKQN